MSHRGTAAATVSELWRYPVKSMAGERLEAVQVTGRGLDADREFALVDPTDDRVVTAKNPRRWPHLLDLGASVPDPGSAPLRVVVTLPDGSSVDSDDQGAAGRLSRAVGRDVLLQRVGAPGSAARLAASGTGRARAEELSVDLDGSGAVPQVTDFELPEASFADSAPVHVLTTATLTRLRQMHPDGSVAVRRFRPNVVVDTGAEPAGFVEQGWVGRTLRLGEEVRLAVTRPCPRCIMVTLAQAGLPRDVGVLRTVARANGLHAGVYATVLHGGQVRCGDRAVVE
jgi:uncharacterized protein YcbX